MDRSQYNKLKISSIYNLLISDYIAMSHINYSTTHVTKFVLALRQLISPFIFAVGNRKL